MEVVLEETFVIVIECFPIACAENAVVTDRQTSCLHFLKKDAVAGDNFKRFYLRAFVFLFMYQIPTSIE